MALSASLLLRQTQSLVMTPQLMQSIQLLQMNFLELNNFIAQEVEKNPLLEVAAPANGGQGDFEPQGFDGADGGRSPDRSDEAPLQPSRAERLSEALDTGVENVFQDDAGPRKADAPELLQQWKSMPGGAGESSEGYDLDDFVAGQVTLKDHLGRQIPFTVTSDTERLIARHLTDMLDENGYLGAEVGELAARLNAAQEDIATVLAKLQELDPPGVYARSLSECLAIQLRLKNRLDPAMSALLANLELLARRDFSSLKKICGVDEEDLLDMLGEIRALDPKPGSSFESAPSESIIPDVIVKAAPDGGWTVEINPDTLPRVLVNQTYYRKWRGPWPSNRPTTPSSPNACRTPTG
ncbi:hypothetical protein [Rhizobium sp. G21]|uniref:RNA polymerase factor sigma-54 n=1 Tax=Rhizobium sp. G21 TaxID=2758439 RepID=UPI001FEEA94C|nr:hypothetical protein [Rhizobium sp. G21]